MKKSTLALWLLVCSILVLDIGQACVRAQDGSAKKIATQNFQIVDREGRKKIEISANDRGNPGLLFYDNQGYVRLNLSVYDTGGSLALSDKPDDIAIGLDGSDGPGFYTYRNGKGKIDLGALAQGATLTLADSSNNPAAALSFDQSKDEAGMAEIPKNRNKIALCEVAPEATMVGVHIKGGYTIEMGTSTGDESHVEIDKNDSTVWKRSSASK